MLRLSIFLKPIAEGYLKNKKGDNYEYKSSRNIKQNSGLFQKRRYNEGGIIV